MAAIESNFIVFRFQRMAWSYFSSIYKKYWVLVFIHIIITYFLIEEALALVWRILSIYENKPRDESIDLFSDKMCKMIEYSDFVRNYLKWV